MQLSQRHSLTVKELTRYIKLKLESDSRLTNIWVQGEISNFVHHRSGHMYFTLKDRDARIKSVMFASHNRSLPFIPKEGAKVIARGSVSVFERDGQYQLYVTQMQPDGIGSLYLAFEQLKQALAQEGLFSAEHKKQIPKIPKAIGVITSPTGAAIRDILITLHRRFPAVPILIYPATVQGTQAVPSIVKGIEVMNKLQEVDVIIVGRGGGSLEELWAFNEEQVARSIFASRIPVISAVGHETDITIADYVADVRAATPTAAAELAVPHHMEIQEQLRMYRKRLTNGLMQQLQTAKQRLERLQSAPCMSQPQRHMIYDHAQRLDRLKEQLLNSLERKLQHHRVSWLKTNHKLQSLHPRQKIEAVKKDVQRLRKEMALGIQTILKQKRQFLISEIRQLDALSPLKVMQRGYSLVYDDSKELISSIEQVQLGDLVHIRMKDGSLNCQVWSMEGEDKNG